MSTRLALALGVLVSLQPLACKDDDCDYTFPLDGHDSYEEDSCDFISEVHECASKGGTVNFENIDDETLEEWIEGCADLIKVCADDSETEDVLRYRAFEEIRGNTNDCVG